jgi:TetR/AcrR family transcriptional regulator, repressor for neighboring sulfatase
MTNGRATGNRNDGSTPVGRDEVIAAVVTHAADLFAERGPAATSIRDIAVRSGVNHGLVFRYLGTKDQLVGAVLDHLADEMALLLQTGASPDVIEAKTERHWKVMARAILDGFPVGQLQQRFPGAAKLVKHAEHSHHNELAGRLAAGNAMALELGWRLFEPFLRSATGTENVSAADLRHAINSGTARMMEP